MFYFVTIIVLLLNFILSTKKKTKIQLVAGETYHMSKLGDYTDKSYCIVIFVFLQYNFK